MAYEPLPKEISDFVNDNIPEATQLMQHFNVIRQIPHASENEAGLRSYIEGFAHENGFDFKKDEAGNIVVYVPGNNGSEDGVCLQSHMDMVPAVIDGSTFDFSKDKIQLKLIEKDGKTWLTADGTSLGADNGIGVAGSLAVATDKNVKHGPLELLFTVREEVGCKGAQALGIPLKSKYLINTDSEDDYTMFNGCAGSITQSGKLTSPRDVSFDKKYTLTIGGLPGGHSGIEIHEPHRPNAFYLGGQVLQDILEAYEGDLHIINVNGDKLQARNKIPNSVEISFVMKNGELLDYNKVEAVVFKSYDRLRRQYPDISIKLLSEDAAPGSDYKAFSADVSEKIFALLISPQSGVYSWMPDGKVPHVSSNFGSIKTTGEGVEIINMIRSDVTADMESRCEQIKKIWRKVGFKPLPLAPDDTMLPWEPSDSYLSRVAMEVGNKVFPNKPAVTAVHAGLEAGIIMLNYPGMDAFSIGPLIKSPHTTEERVEMLSIGRNYRLMTGMLERL